MIKMVETVLNGKYKIILPKHRADRPEWHTQKGWERKRLDYMHLHLNPKGYGTDHEVMYYIGAELGEFPALCQIWGAKVVLFEPNHMAWPVIKAVWEANELRLPLAVFAGFASNKTQLVPPKPDRALYDGIGYVLGSDGWPLYSRGEIVTAHGFSELSQESDGLPQTKIDDLIIASKLPPPTAISLDVEGSEWEVLRGAEKTLREYHPKIWLSLHPEFLFDQYHEYSGDLRRWLREMGYNEELLDYQHEAHFYYSV